MGGCVAWAELSGTQRLVCSTRRKRPRAQVCSLGGNSHAGSCLTLFCSLNEWKDFRLGRVVLTGKRNSRVVERRRLCERWKGNYTLVLEHKKNLFNQITLNLNRKGCRYFLHDCRLVIFLSCNYFLCWSEILCWSPDVTLAHDDDRHQELGHPSQKRCFTAAQPGVFRLWTLSTFISDFYKAALFTDEDPGCVDELSMLLVFVDAGASRLHRWRYKLPEGRLWAAVKQAILLGLRKSVMWEIPFQQFSLVVDKYVCVFFRCSLHRFGEEWSSLLGLNQSPLLTGLRDFCFFGLELFSADKVFQFLQCLTTQIKHWS